MQYTYTYYVDFRLPACGSIVCISLKMTVCWLRSNYLVFMIGHPRIGNIHREYTPGIYIGNIHQEYTLGIYIWNIHREYTSGIYIPNIHREYTSRIYIGNIHVRLTVYYSSPIEVDLRIPETTDVLLR